MVAEVPGNHTDFVQRCVCCGAAAQTTDAGSRCARCAKHVAAFERASRVSGMIIAATFICAIFVGLKAPWFLSIAAVVLGIAVSVLTHSRLVAEAKRMCSRNCASVSGLRVLL